MNTRLLQLAFAPALLLTGVTAHGASSADYALEPCINGGVSASGLFASQAEEDRALAERLALELEPCINGEVSASGRFSSQAEEDMAGRRMAGG
jgi:hypothetical protein